MVKSDREATHTWTMSGRICAHPNYVQVVTHMLTPISTPTRKRLKHGDKVLLSLMDHQVGLIIEHLPISENLLGALYHSRVWDGIVEIRCTLDALSELAVNLEANKTTDITLQESFEPILDAIAEVEQRYWVRPRLARIADQG